MSGSDDHVRHWKPNSEDSVPIHTWVGSLKEAFGGTAESFAEAVLPYDRDAAKSFFHELDSLQGQNWAGFQDFRVKKATEVQHMRSGLPIGSRHRTMLNQLEAVFRSGYSLFDTGTILDDQTAVRCPVPRTHKEKVPVYVNPAHLADSVTERSDPMEQAATALIVASKELAKASRKVSGGPFAAYPPDAHDPWPPLPIESPQGASGPVVESTTPRGSHESVNRTPLEYRKTRMIESITDKLSNTSEILTAMHPLVSLQDTTRISEAVTSLRSIGSEKELVEALALPRNTDTRWVPTDGTLCKAQHLHEPGSGVFNALQSLRELYHPKTSHLRTLSDEQARDLDWKIKLASGISASKHTDS